MTKAILLHEPGDVSVLRLEEIHLEKPKATQVLIRHKAIGVNFIDVYYRTGLYTWPNTPLTPGAEGAGEVLAVGEAVTAFKPGDRVAYSVRIGSYAEERLIEADRLVLLPAEVSYETAAAIMLKGMTAQYLLRQTFPVQAGQTILFHAAAGGVGLIAGQWAKHIGATIIGTVGSDEKMHLAKQNGYTHVINYNKEDFVARVRELTAGQGVDVVYDSVGQNTYPGSLDCLKKRGMWVCFGQSSGVIKNFELAHLAQKGSLFATRPLLFDYIVTHEALNASAQELFSVVESGAVKVSINQRFALKDAALAHQKLESRQTIGSTILIP